MTDPSAFTPLAVDFDVEWDSGERFGPLEDGRVFEHAHISLENGYVVSVARANFDDQPTIGFENGQWEAVILKHNPNPLGFIFGESQYVPATEANHLTTHDYEGLRLVGNLDNAGINALVTKVSQLPAVPTHSTIAEEFDFEAAIKNMIEEEDNDEDE